MWANKKLGNIPRTLTGTVFPHDQALQKLTQCVAKKGKIMYNDNDLESSSQDQIQYEQPSKAISVTDWVFVKYEDREYPGESMSCNGRDYEVSVMHCRFGKWKCPEQKDKILYDKSMIIRKINPVPVGSWGQFIFEYLGVMSSCCYIRTNPWGKMLCITI